MAARVCDPRVRVAAVIPQGNGLVLVRHQREGHEYHLLPGGGVEAGETLEAALVREVLEETGIACTVVAPLFLSDAIDPSGSRHAIQITFLVCADSTPDSFRSADARVLGAEVVPVHALSRLDLRPPMADVLVEAAATQYEVPARYLGALWVPEVSANGTEGSPATDG